MGLKSSCIMRGKGNGISRMCLRKEAFTGEKKNNNKKKKKKKYKKKKNK